MSEAALTVTEQPEPADVATVVDGLVAYNDTVAERQNRRPLAVFARVDGRVVGGASGATQWRWLHVAHLWVDEACRGRDLGTALMAAIESAARERGCIGAHLDTFSFQARGFYEKLGYEVLGDIADYPPGHARYFLRKRFGKTPAQGARP